MKVTLGRQLFIGGSRYRDRGQGVEIPDSIGGKEVVFFNKSKPHDPEKELVLPKDCVPFEEAKAKKLEAKPAPVALSQLPKQVSNEELLEKKK